ncbi:MAG: pilus assembly PilX N-terminal domain-containing protein [Desulfosarcina sp.]|nr:pilus assembly PilX N-terminal domain-containing protein [Desulfobacterales bacterium]
MKIIRDSICNENGSVLLLSVVILMLLTVLGIAATTTSTIEIHIAGNDKINKMVFFAADSGISYVAVNPGLYDSNNTTEDNHLFFPNNADPNETYPLSDQLEFNGKVSYRGKSQMPSESGYSVETVFAIKYEIESNATGPNNGARTVNAGFYRIGL